MIERRQFLDVRRFGLAGVEVTAPADVINEAVLITVPYLLNPPPFAVNGSTTLDGSQKVVRVLTAGITITLDATPISGANYRIRNASGGDIFIDPNGQELEDDPNVDTMPDGDVWDISFLAGDGWRLNG